MRVLLVSNGHGEAAIASRIAVELRALGSATQHLALVGTPAPTPEFPAYGPRREMPSGGLVAMGNIASFARDVRAGFFVLLAEQVVALRRARNAYDQVVAVGDAYCLALALCAARPTTFVGTAKSVAFAPYGPFERTILGRARHCFVRDEATAHWLQRRGVRARAPGNVIADLLDGSGADAPYAPGAQTVALLPGSREAAYRDAARLVAVFAAVYRRLPSARARLSLAPSLSAARFVEALRAEGWEVGPSGEPLVPFEVLLDGAPVVAAFTGALGALLRGATIALGQAGTANEAAAAAGVPVVALQPRGAARAGWYRRRQQRLLGEAMAVVPDELEPAAERIVELIEDPQRRERMARTGRERMGPPGGARAIARAVVGS